MTFQSLVLAEVGFSNGTAHESSTGMCWVEAEPSEGRIIAGMTDGFPGCCPLWLLPDYPDVSSSLYPFLSTTSSCLGASQLSKKGVSQNKLLLSILGSNYFVPMMKNMCKISLLLYLILILLVHIWV